MHIHTLLSPCGDLDSTPETIVKMAKSRGIDIIGITDHNSTRHCRLAEYYAKKYNIFVLCGAEVTSREEAHCLCYFKDHDSLDAFQQFLDAHIPDIKNNPDFFGDQVQIDENDNIVYEEERLLTSAIDAGVDALALKVRDLDGIFIPAHIDKMKNSIISQLGFIPFDLVYDAVELSEHGDREKILKAHPYLVNTSFTRSSDAHFPDRVGTVFCTFEMEDLSFEEIKKTLHQTEGRRVLL